MTDPVEGPPLEAPACPLCGWEESSLRYAGGDFAPYGLARCAACRLHFLSPRPEEGWMRALYASGYFEAEGVAGYDDYRAQETALRRTFRRFLGTLSRRGVASGALLEVGCGLGYLLDEARPWFERRDGTELSSDAALEAGKRCDDVAIGGIETVPAGPTYDVVLSNHVIEHVYDPVGFLRAQTQRLRPGGHVVATTPWMGSAWQRALGRRWPSFKLPEHVLYFDHGALARAFEAAGLREIRRIPYPHAFPVALVAAKLGFALEPGSGLGACSLWIPQTTLALAGRFAG